MFQWWLPTVVGFFWCQSFQSLRVQLIEQVQYCLNCFRLIAPNKILLCKHGPAHLHKCTILPSYYAILLRSLDHYGELSAYVRILSPLLPITPRTYHSYLTPSWESAPRSSCCCNHWWKSIDTQFHWKERTWVHTNPRRPTLVGAVICAPILVRVADVASLTMMSSICDHTFGAKKYSKHLLLVHRKHRFDIVLLPHH